MNKADFQTLFVRCIGDALDRAKCLTDRSLPTALQIELHGGGVSGETVSVGEAIDRMYLGDGVLPPIIDIGPKEVRGCLSIIFVRISPQPAVSYESTWNTPKGNGPFKIIEPMKVVFLN